MKLSRTVTYALLATLQLAENETGRPVPCSRLAEQGEMPERFLLQILRHLVNHGILESTRGVEGGYRLHRRAEDVSLLELIEAVEGPLAPDVPARTGFTPEASAKLHAALQQVTTASRRQLQAIKLSQLLVRQNT